MFNEANLPSSYKSGLQAPLDGKGFFADLDDMKDLSNHRPLSWYKNMVAVDMSTGKNYEWIESNVGVLDESYSYPQGVISFGIDYSNLSFNFVEIIGNVPVTPEVAVLPTVISYNDFVLNGDQEIVEIGTLLSNTLTTLFTRGKIDNKDEHADSNLTGVSHSLSFVGNGIGFATGIINFTAIKSMLWTASTSYAVGDELYYDSLGAEASNLDAERVEGSLQATLSRSAVYKVFYYLGTSGASPAVSNDVRALTNKLLSITETIDCIIPVDANTQEVTFYLPKGKNVTVIDVSTGIYMNNTMTISDITVKDAGGLDVNYEKFIIPLGAGFSQNTSFNLIVT